MLTPGVYLKVALWRSGFNRGTALLIFFQEDILFFLVTDPQRPRGSLSGWDEFSFRPAPGSPRMLTRTYITQRYSTVIRLWYRTFCCTASTLVMLTRRYFSFERLLED